MNTFNFKLKNFYLFAFMIFSLSIFGQGGQGREKMKDKFKAQKVAFITSELELTEAESQKFWPIFNSYQSELETLRSANDKKPTKDMTDKEAEDLIYAKLDGRSKEIDIQKKYVQKLKTAIPARKIALLFGLEKEFKEKVISNMKERRIQKKGGMGNE
ncbi:MAG: hypothetical protein IPN86_09335 [Saprospiraceae bacterium]|jgi:hypothetical protein|nr:hypothetical protein [Saprospiraceae bacterium]